MREEQKKFEGYTEGQMAREILMNAIAEALDTENISDSTVRRRFDEPSGAGMIHNRRMTILLSSSCQRVVGKP